MEKSNKILLVFQLFTISGIRSENSCLKDDLCNRSKLSCLDINPELNDLNQEDPKLIKIIRDRYLIPPPKDPQNLNLPKDEELELKGQFNQVEIINEKLFGNGKFENGFFVEAGAANGYDISNTLYFEMAKNWTGLLVEADPKAFETLKSVKRNAWLIHTCLSTKTHPEIVEFDVAGLLGGIINKGVKHTDFYVYNPFMRDENYKRIINNIHATRKTMTMQCLPLYSILKAIGKTEVDLLSLDIEGAEYEVLKATFKPKDFKFKVGTVEITSFGKVFGRSIVEFNYLLKRNKYVHAYDGGHDTIIRHHTFSPLS